MTLRVVGAGLGRTGTNTLKGALEQLLGGTCHHMREVFAHPDEIEVWRDAALGTMPDWTTFLVGYTAQVDWPGASFYRELADAFPDAIVLLSLRDPDEWFRSANNTIFTPIGRDVPEGEDAWHDMIQAVFRARFCTDFGDPVAMKQAFVRHNDEVRDTIPRDRLVEWRVDDGWAPICDALGVATPAGPLPVTNTTADFRQMAGLPPL
jgi:hypothetical protein